MKSIFVYYFFCVVVGSLFSSSSSALSKPKICLNCKYIIPDITCKNMFAKCALFEKDDDASKYYYYLVNGEMGPRSVDYYFCSTARHSESMCGKEGGLFQFQTSYKKRKAARKQQDDDDDDDDAI